MKIRCMMAAALMAAGMAQAAYVTIGNTGNADDTTGYGGVDYEYKISDTEVTIAEFQASGAGDGGEGYWNDGTRTVGTAAPASCVSLYEAMRYCNYLTSGDVDDGVYVFSGGTYQSTDRASALTTYGTIYAVPTEDEWYKAAYYTGSGYSDYADGSDTQPAQDDGSGNGWNYYDEGYVYDSPNYVRETDVGATEQNGTRDMMGNVWEWQEDPGGVIRGGAYYHIADSLRSSYRSTSDDPSNENISLGFRVAEVVPEPATASLMALIAGLGFLIRRHFVA